MQLTGGVQEARTVAQAGGHVPAVANGMAQCLKLAVVLRMARQVRVDREVVARAEPLQMRRDDRACGFGVGGFGVGVLRHFGI